MRGREEASKDGRARASELARHMVKRFGMSDRLGNVTYGHPIESRYLKTSFGLEERDYSEKTAEEIDEEVRRIVDESYQRVRTIVTGRRQKLDTLVHRLMEKETIEEAELQEVISKMDFGDAIEELVPNAYDVTPKIENGVYA